MAMTVENWRAHLSTEESRPVYVALAREFASRHRDEYDEALREILADLSREAVS